MQRLRTTRPRSRRAWRRVEAAEAVEYLLGKDEASVLDAWDDSAELDKLTVDAPARLARMLNERPASERAQAIGKLEEVSPLLRRLLARLCKVPLPRGRGRPRGASAATTDKLAERVVIAVRVFGFRQTDVWAAWKELPTASAYNVNYHTLKRRLDHVLPPLMLGRHQDELAAIVRRLDKKKRLRVLDNILAGRPAFSGIRVR